MTKFRNYDLPGQLPVLSWNPIVMRCPGCELSKPDAKGWIPCWHIRMCNRMMNNCKLSIEHREIRAGIWPAALHKEHAYAPRRRKKPALICAQFMGDMGQVHTVLRAHIFDIMRLCPWHTFLVLTKWPENITEDVPDNCWVGTSITDQATADARIPKLLEVKATHKWVSIEPILGPVNMGKWLPELGFIACGPETGTGARGYTAQWMINLSNDCRDTAVPFYDNRDEDSLFFERREWPEEWKK